MGAIFDRAKSLGVMAAYVEPKVGNSPYLSPGYFEAVKMVVEEAKKRGMHVLFDDDGGYPSGFAQAFEGANVCDCMPNVQRGYPRPGGL